MSWDGNGNAKRIQSFQADRDASIKILAQHVDSEFDNYATMLQNCITRDSQTPPTATQNFNSQRISNLADGTATTDAATVRQTSAGKNLPNALVNGSFRFWQRYAYTGSTAVVGTAAGLYCADRWYACRDGTATGYTMTQVTFAHGDFTGAVYPGTYTGIKLQRDAGNSSTTDLTLVQSLDLETVSLINASNPYFYVSFYAKAGANYTGSTDLAVYGNTAANQKGNVGVVAAGWSQQSPGSAAVNLTTTFQRFSAVFSEASVWPLSLAIGVRRHGLVGTAGADDSITIAGFKVEILDPTNNAIAPTPYADPDFAAELLRCQRFYWKTFALNTAPAQSVGNANAYAYRVQVAGTAAGHLAQLPLPTPLRAAASATITTYNPGAANANWRNTTGPADSGVPTVTAGSERMLEIVNPQVAGDAASNVVRIHAAVDNEF